jgi:hypothetical protein
MMFSLHGWREDGYPTWDHSLVILLRPEPMGHPRYVQKHRLGASRMASLGISPCVLKERGVQSLVPRSLGEGAASPRGSTAETSRWAS